MRNLCTILATMSMLLLRAAAASDTEQLTTGTHFVVGFIHPDRAAGEELNDSGYCVIITSRFHATVSVGSAVYQAAPDRPLIVKLPAVDLIDIRSDVPIHVASRQHLEGNGEQSMHLPVSSWGNVYRAFSWWTDRHGLDSSTMIYSTAKRRIIAAYDDTGVTVETVNGIIDTVLHTGESWLVSEQLDTTALRLGSSDPTGLAITSSKPVGVVSGHSKAAVLAYPDALPASGPYARTANRCRGNLQEAMLPTSMAGTAFVTVPLVYTPTRDRGLDLRDQGIGDDRGDVVRFIALEDSTAITATTSKMFDTVAIIGKGQSWLDSRVEAPTFWQTSRPTLCAQYGKSYGHITSQATRPEDDPSTDAGMPLLMTIPDVTRWVNSVRVHAPVETFNALAIATLTSSIGNLRIDGKPLASVSRPTTIAGTAYSTATVIVPGGAHVVSADSGSSFICWTYGSLDGYQLGRIYGSVAGFDIRTACLDSVTIEIAYTNGTAQATATIESPNDSCSQLALLYVEEALNVTWTRDSNAVDIRPTDSLIGCSGVLVATTTSGRTARRFFSMSTTSVPANSRHSAVVAQYLPATDCFVVSNLAEHLGDELALFSIHGQCLVRDTIANDQAQIRCSQLPCGSYIVRVNNSTLLVMKLQLPR